MEVESKRPLVIYHGGCLDGFTSAWVANRFLPNPELVGMGYTDEPPTDEQVRDREVYIVDFSFKRQFCERIYANSRSLIILDHHKTAEADLKGLPYATFDMNQSGAGLTQKFFGEGARNWLVDYVEDRDLWRFNLPGSKEINAAVACTDMTIEAWDRLDKEGPNKALQKGIGALAFETMAAKKAAEQAIMYTFHGHNVPFVNVQYTLASVTAGMLAQDHPFAVSWFQKADRSYQYSLRSRGDDSVDVSEIALLHGGGGHKNASGFTCNQSPMFLSDVLV